MSAPDRLALLYAALAAVLVKRRTPELAVVHSLLDSWRGISFIVSGMLRYGFGLSLVSYPRCRCATFLHYNSPHTGEDLADPLMVDVRALEQQAAL